MKLTVILVFTLSRIHFSTTSRTSKAFLCGPLRLNLIQCVSIVPNVLLFGLHHMKTCRTPGLIYGDRCLTVVITKSASSLSSTRPNLTAWRNRWSPWRWRWWRLDSSGLPNSMERWMMTTQVRHTPTCRQHVDKITAVTTNLLRLLFEGIQKKLESEKVCHFVLKIALN